MWQCQGWQSKCLHTYEKCWLYTHYPSCSSLLRQGQTTPLHGVPSDLTPSLDPRCPSLLGAVTKSWQALLQHRTLRHHLMQLLQPQKLGSRQAPSSQSRLRSRELHPHSKMLRRREGRPQALTAKQVRHMPTPSRIAPLRVRCASLSCCP